MLSIQTLLGFIMKIIEVSGSTVGGTRYIERAIAILEKNPDCDIEYHVKFGVKQNRVANRIVNSLSVFERYNKAVKANCNSKISVIKLEE